MLIYARLDQSNGGIIRNLSRGGIAVLPVSRVCVGQRVQVHFELPSRARIEAWGEVMWTDSDRACGIRFLDLPPRMARCADEWIFGDLLQRLSLRGQQAGAFPGARSFSRPATTMLFADAAEDDGLIVSPSPVKVIELPIRPDLEEPVGGPVDAEAPPSQLSQLDWLSQPLSNRGIAWLGNTLSVVAALLLVALVFLSVNREAPKWPAAMSAGAAVVVAVVYWGFFRVFGGVSPGVRLARLMGNGREDEEEPGSARFR